MPEPDLTYVSRQLLLLQATLEAMRREQARAADNLEIVKADIVNLRADMHAGFALLDSRLRPLEAT